MTAERSPLAAEIRATVAVAAPLAVANLAQMAIALTNTLMVGHLGAVPLAAAGLGGALYFMLVMLCQGVLAAVAPLAAHAIGAGDHPTAGRVAGAGLVVAAMLAAPVIAMLTALPWLLALLGYDPELAAEIARFLRMIRWGAPAFLGVAVLRFLLVAMFRTRIVMLIPLLAIPVNGLLNWMLIFGHLGMPAWGSAGSGCASAIVQWLMLLCFAVCMLTIPTQMPVRLAVRVLSEIPRILRLGLPIGVLLGLEVGVFAMTGILMGLLGADALGAHQLVLNVASVTFMVPLGLGQAATVRVAFQLGLGAPAAARRAGYVAVALGASFMVTMAMLLLLMPRSIASAYVSLDDPAIRRIIETHIGACDRARHQQQQHRHCHHEGRAERHRDISGAARRRRSAEAELERDPHGRRLPQTERHHEGHAGDVEDELMRAQRIGAKQTHQDAGHREDPDFEPQQDADRQSEPQDAGDLGQHADRQPDRHLRRYRQHADSETQQHQPLHDRAGAAGAGAAPRRHSEMAEDQHPVQETVDRDRQQRNQHDDARAEHRDHQEAQHGDA